MYRAWKELPSVLAKRWLPLRPLLQGCFGKGLVVEIQTGEEIVLPGLPLYMQGGVASYVRTQKKVVLTRAAAFGPLPDYGEYRPDIHEVGHAVWALLLTPLERWAKYFPLWKLGHLLDSYSGTAVEEGWAQDFEAYWTEEVAGDWQAGRERLKATGRVRYNLIVGIMLRLGADG